MARTFRDKPTSSGPGRGSPRSRTTARPGERASKERQRPTQVAVPQEAATSSPVPVVRGKAMGFTWRLIVLAVVIAAIALTLAQSLRIYFAQSAELAQVRAQIQEKQTQISTLEDQLARWDDPQYVKIQARERLGWVMPGETGYRVIGFDGKPLGGDSTTLAGAETPAPGLWWEKLVRSVAVADQPVAEATTPTPNPPTDTPKPTATKSN